MNIKTYQVVKFTVWEGSLVNLPEGAILLDYDAIDVGGDQLGAVVTLLVPIVGVPDE
jgi:hypothetical protein